jgi:hypothetical protein
MLHQPSGYDVAGGSACSHSFGVFMDDRTVLAHDFRRRWPDVDLVQMNQPLRGLAVRFQNSVYTPEDETIPEVISAGVQEISLQVPDVRFVLLRTECWGGANAATGASSFRMCDD